MASDLNDGLESMPSVTSTNEKAVDQNPSTSTAMFNQLKPYNRICKSRGFCEDCGEELSIRGYLNKCRRCNKKAYKRLMRIKAREAKLKNASCVDCKNKAPVGFVGTKPKCA